MKNRSFYIQIKAYCDQEGYTISQISNALPSQVISLLNITDDDVITKVHLYWPSVQSLLIHDLQEELNQQTLELLKDQAKTWLDLNFPDWTATKDFSNPSNRQITVHLDGEQE